MTGIIMFLLAGTAFLAARFYLALRDSIWEQERQKEDYEAYCERWEKYHEHI